MAKSKRSRRAGPIYQLKVTLQDIDPPIWRRVQVPGKITLSGLHLVIQKVMGWENYHLYQFTIDGTEYGEPSSDAWSEVKNTRLAKLNRVATGEGSSFMYEYDFGDGWEHQITVEKILLPEPGTQYPICIDGARACPPEDCGGVWGYQDMLETIQDPEDEDYEDIVEWLGDNFDPEAFDLESVNRALQHIR